MPDWFVRSGDDLLKMLDDLLTGTSSGAWWDGFFADESRRLPLLADWPDENLAATVSRRTAARTMPGWSAGR